MKFCDSWSYRPFTEPTNEKKAMLPYICRISHGEHGFTADFIDNGAPNSRHILMWRARGNGEFTTAVTENGTASVDGLPSDTDFEFYVKRANDGDARSDVRLVRTGYAPGSIVNYLHPDDPVYDFSGRFLDSPSIVRLPSGALITAMGVHATYEHGENLSILYRSDDNGESWKYLCELYPARWGKLFYDSGRLYCLCASCSYGDLLIGCSEDEGLTWKEPTVLSRGGCTNHRAGWHHTPMPVLRHNGRLITDMQFGGWRAGYFADYVISAKEGSDLLDRNNWAISKPWDHRDHSEILPVANGGETGAADTFKNTLGGIEGNAVVAPNGDIWVIHRFGDRKPLILEYDPDDPWGELKNARLTDMPIKDSKADIEFDSVSGRYYMLGSYSLAERNNGRTVCALMSSADLAEWRLDRIVLDFRDEDPKMFGIQYFDFVIDGDDIVFVCRTACCGAYNFHDSNHQTFHRIKSFRSCE